MTWQHISQVISNRRTLFVVLLGFSSGLPLALSNTTIQAWFTVSGASLLAVGSLSLLGLPYVWKFLWAPLLDRFVPPYLGRRRGWIAITQVGLCLAILLLAPLNPSKHAVIIYGVALLIAFISATQDIAIDAYRTDILLPEERGFGLAGFVFGYRVAMLVSASLILIVADHIGWQISFYLLAGLMMVNILVTYGSPEIPAHLQAPPTTLASYVGPLRDLMQRENIVWILLFILLYKLGDALALSLLTNFLLHGLGFSLTDVGVAYKTVSIVAMIVGAFTGGILMIGLGLFRSLLLFGVLQAISNLMFMVLALAGKSYTLMVASIFIENFCSGMSTAAFLAFITTLCDHRYTAAQFALLSTLSSVGRVICGPIAAEMVQSIGWASFFAWTFVICFPSLVILLYLRRNVTQQGFLQQKGMPLKAGVQDKS